MGTHFYLCPFSFGHVEDAIYMESFEICFFFFSPFTKHTAFNIYSGFHVCSVSSLSAFLLSGIPLYGCARVQHLSVEVCLPCFQLGYCQ